VLDRRAALERGTQRSATCRGRRQPSRRRC
jgi:hypothetical protein